MSSSDPSLESLFSIAGKVALVTGGGAGIGHGIVSVLARAGGAAVAINDLAGATGHKVLAQELNAERHQALAVDGDVSSPEDVARMIAQVEDTLGPIDILVNNAGIGFAHTIDETDPDDWNRVMAVHLGGTFNVSKTVLAGMKARGCGCIIQLSSIVGHQGALKGHIAYGTAKAGLLGFTKTLARDAASSNVRVNAVAPGLVRSQMLEETHGEDGIEALRKTVPLQALATPDDIAAAVLFHASPAAQQITGTTLDVTGGMLMR